MMIRISFSSPMHAETTATNGASSSLAIDIFTYCASRRLPRLSLSRHFLRHNTVLPQDESFIIIDFALSNAMLIYFWHCAGACPASASRRKITWPFIFIRPGLSRQRTLLLPSRHWQHCRGQLHAVLYMVIATARLSGFFFSRNAIKYPPLNFSLMTIIFIDWFSHFIAARRHHCAFREMIHYYFDLADYYKHVPKLMYIEKAAITSALSFSWISAIIVSNFSKLRLFLLIDVAMIYSMPVYFEISDSRPAFAARLVLLALSSPWFINFHRLIFEDERLMRALWLRARHADTHKALAQTKAPCRAPYAAPSLPPPRRSHGRFHRRWAIFRPRDALLLSFLADARAL